MLFPGTIAKRVALKEKRDDRRHRQGIAILESKRWLQPAGRGRRRTVRYAVNEILRYLSSAEVASDRAVRCRAFPPAAGIGGLFQGTFTFQDFLELDVDVLLGVKGAGRHSRWG